MWEIGKAPGIRSSPSVTKRRKTPLELRQRNNDQNEAEKKCCPAVRAEIESWSSSNPKRFDKSFLNFSNKTQFSLLFKIKLMVGSLVGIPYHKAIKYDQPATLLPNSISAASIFEFRLIKKRERKKRTLFCSFWLHWSLGRHCQDDTRATRGDWP